MSETRHADFLERWRVACFGAEPQEIPALVRLSAEEVQRRAAEAVGRRETFDEGPIARLYLDGKELGSFEDRKAQIEEEAEAVARSYGFIRMDERERPPVAPVKHESVLESVTRFLRIRGSRP